MTTVKETKPIKGRHLIKQLGGAKRVHDELLEYQHRVENMESRRPDLMEKYPDKWVAMADGEIVAIAVSLEDILEELDKLKLGRAGAVVEYLNTHPRSMIL